MVMLALPPFKVPIVFACESPTVSELPLWKFMLAPLNVQLVTDMALPL